MFIVNHFGQFLPSHDASTSHPLGDNATRFSKLMGCGGTFAFMAKRKTNIGPDGIWRPRTLKIQYTDEKLTPAAGLGPFVDAFVQSPQFEKLKQCVPGRSSNAAYDSMQFVLPLMAGFWHGSDCLEDMETLDEKQPDLRYRFEGIPSPRAFGDYLRDFRSEHFEAINELLTKQGLAARKEFAPDQPLILDMDSTSHIQSGSQIEGLGVNYKGEICLDSLDSFDELGFCYGFRLREGGTFSSVGAPAEIDRIFRHLSYSQEKHYRADSAFCNEECITACIRRGAYFTITAHGNTGWESRVSQVTNWQAWQYTPEEIEVAAAKKKTLPEVEVGTLLYKPQWSENLRFYIVVKRTRVKEATFDLFSPQGEQNEGWKYYGVITNWNLLKHMPQRVLEHHAKRGNSENFIREKKIHLDLKHFPCLQMNANFGYGLIAMVAYNFLRIIARLDEPTRPHYAKKLRNKFLFIPGKVVKHARQMFLRIPQIFRKEVELMKSGWAGNLEAALAMG